MKERKLYYSRKRGKIVIEGIIKKHGKSSTIHIVTLPSPIKLIKSWYLQREKHQKIMEKINRVDFKEKKSKK